MHLRGVYFVRRIAAGAGGCRCNRCNRDISGRRDSRLAPHRNLCRSAGGCDRRFSSKICHWTQFSIVRVYSVLIAAGCSQRNRRWLRIRVDVVRPGAARAQFPASIRWTKLLPTAKPSNKPCNSVRAILLPLLPPLPVLPCPALMRRMFERLTTDYRSEQIPVIGTSRTPDLTPLSLNCCNR